MNRNRVLKETESLTPTAPDNSITNITVYIPISDCCVQYLWWIFMA